MTEKITATISTKNRYFTTLPLSLESIIHQTKKPDELIIFDDGEHLDLREHQIYQYLFRCLDHANIEWRVIFGEKRGQIWNHQKALEIAKHELIFRMDDDNVLEPHVLENLYTTITSDERIGAVGGIIADPHCYKDISPITLHHAWKIENIFLGLNIQWFRHRDTEIKFVDSLYSSFLFRKAAANHGYTMQLSPIAFREETIFTYEMKRAGWKIAVNPNALTWHFRYKDGGIRDHVQIGAYHDHDNLIFLEKLKEWGIQHNDWKIVVLDNGIGDHFAFKHILPDMKARFANIALFVCYPDVFSEDHTFIGDLQDLYYMGVDPLPFNIYKFMADHNWKSSIVDAFRKLYL